MWCIACDIINRPTDLSRITLSFYPVNFGFLRLSVLELGRGTLYSCRHAKTAKIEKVVLLSVTLTIGRCDAE